MGGSSLTNTDRVSVPALCRDTHNMSGCPTEHLPGLFLLFSSVLFLHLRCFVVQSVSKCEQLNLHKRSSNIAEIAQFSAQVQATAFVLRYLKTRDTLIRFKSRLTDHLLNGTFEFFKKIIAPRIKNSTEC